MDSSTMSTYALCLNRRTRTADAGTALRAVDKCVLSDAPLDNRRDQ